MPSAVDHVADAAKGSVELVRLAKLYDFPDFVKNATDENLTPKHISKSAYADPRYNQFPCHTAASTWLSALFYQEKRAEFHVKDQRHIESRLSQSIEYFRIKAATDSIRARWEALHKNADDQLPDTAFAYVWVNEDGTKQRQLRMKTAAEVKAAAEYLVQYRDRFSFPQRHQMARRILEKAAAYGAGIGPQMEFLEKQAGRGVCDPREVVNFIEGRAAMVGNLELKTHFNKMAATIKAAPRRILQPETMLKLAETLDELDRRHGFVNRYNDGLTRPEDVIFAATFAKAASELAALVTTTSGRSYEKQALRKLSADDVRGLFGSDFTERVVTPLGEIDPEKMAEEVATLPRPDAEMLDGLLSENGITPSLTKGASVKQGFDDRQMSAIAESYIA